MDAKQTAELVIRRVREFVQPALDSIVEQITQTKTTLRREIEERIAGIPHGKDGTSVTIEEVAPLLTRSLAEAIALLPVPKNGENGEPGESIVGPRGETGAKGDTGESIVGPVGDKGDPGERGECGPPGDEGIDGIDGKSVTVDDLMPAVSKLVADASTAVSEAVQRQIAESVARIEPIKGDKGADGTSVTVDELLPAVKQWFDALPRAADGRDGVDGKSVTVEDISHFVESAIAKGVLDLERRGMDMIQRCIDRIEKPKNGVDGINGKDGLGFDDMTVDYDGERTITQRYQRGDQLKEFSFKIPMVLERGVWKEGTTYERGDGVTFGGSYWIALTDTKSKPGDGNADFRLVVKKGRDGRDGEKGERGERGFAGKPEDRR